MKCFTYKDYLEYKKMHNNYILNDQDEEYEYGKNVVQIHDKSYKTILLNKKEAALFINDALELDELEKVSSNSLVYYNKSYVTKNFENKEADIVYKLKDREIFFLIEHQSTIDYKMPLRITEYASSIILSALDRKKSRKKPGILPKSLCLDKIEKVDEFEEKLKQIIKEEYGEEEKESLINIIYYNYSKKIG